MEHLLFFSGLSFQIVHALDAVRCKEWISRMLIIGAGLFGLADLLIHSV